MRESNGNFVQDKSIYYPIILLFPQYFYEYTLTLVTKYKEMVQKLLNFLIMYYITEFLAFHLYSI